MDASHSIGNHVRLYLFDGLDALSETGFQTGLAVLPEVLQTEVLSYKFQPEANRVLMGKLLLAFMLRQDSMPSNTLKDLRRTKQGKPFIEGVPDFSISHSASIVMVGKASLGKIGIDVEAIRKVPVHSFQPFFQAQEWDEIINVKDVEHCFFKFWSRKEAVMKADGRGMEIPLVDLNVLEDIVQLKNGKHFHLHDLEMPEEFVGSVATSTKIEALELRLLSWDFIQAWLKSI